MLPPATAAQFRENDQPVFKPFSVTATVTYTDLVTNTIKSAPLSFNCTL